MEGRFRQVQTKGAGRVRRLTEGKLRQREPDDGGKVQAKGADGPREAKGKGSRLSEGM